MSALTDALAALAAPHLARVYEQPPAAIAPAPVEVVGRTAIARARGYREAGERLAERVGAAVDAVVAAEASRLAPLGVALDWLADAPLDGSLAQALVDAGAPAGDHGEVVGLLGIARGESAILGGDEPGALDVAGAATALARARLGRLAGRVEAWLEARS